MPSTTLRLLEYTQLRPTAPGLTAPHPQQPHPQRRMTRNADLLAQRISASFRPFSSLAC
jgi:hypothetical protein